MRAVPEQTTAEVELSIVIPTHRRPGRLLSCIDSLAAQERLPESLELVVVLDGADRETERSLESLRTPFPVRVVVQGHSGQATARNRGAKEAHGRFILFLDDDIVARPQLVGAHVGALR
jgi:glycosyltransferase involved in cell wall biosynthesis